LDAGIFKMKKILNFLVYCFFIGTANGVSAGIITTGTLQKNTDNFYVTDTATNLQWYDWSTTGVNYSTLQSSISSGGTFEEKITRGQPA